ncbi:hypothetical protein MKX03_030980 [Papaver bracteatum]|nr:hypothetical protein MKX03_030980 [Papaver bracteatum]
MAPTIFSSCSSSTTTTRLSKFDTIRRSGSVHLRPPPSFLSFKPRNPAGFGASISMQRRSSNSSITAASMSMSTRFPRVKLHGKAVAEEIVDEISNEVTRMRYAIGVTPMLAVIIVGEKNHSPVHLENILWACYPEPPFLFPSVIPCTARGCIELLHEYSDIRIKGTSVVVIGNGTDTDIVTPAAANLLRREGAKVTVVHRGTENLAEIVRQADILISAAERAYVVRGNIIDRKVGLNYRFVGDVCYEEPYEWASHVTPAPGGMESMTTAMLLSNTLLMAKRALKFE